jgi:AcrR family transcriptional regulator
MYAPHTYLRKYAVSTSERERYHHGDLRRSILDLARTHLEAEGVETLSLRALADAAKVSRMAPYRHFADKAALVEALAQAGFDDLRQKMIEADKADAREALQEYAVVYVEFALSHPNLFAIMYGSGIPTPDPDTTSPEASVLALVSDRVGQVVPKPRAAEARLAGWSLMHGLAMLLANGRVRQCPEDIAGTVRGLLSALLRGFAA